MVTRGLVGVTDGELPQRLVESPALADVGVDRDRVAGAGVCSSEHSPALRSRTPRDAVRSGRRRGIDLHVTELPDVEVVRADRGPADEDVGRALDQTLADHHPLAVIRVTALAAEYGSYTDGPACLICRNSGSASSRPVEQHQVTPACRRCRHRRPGARHRRRRSGRAGDGGLPAASFDTQRRPPPRARARRPTSRTRSGGSSVIRSWPSDRLGELPRGTGARAPPGLPVDVRPRLLLLLWLEEGNQLVDGDRGRTRSRAAPTARTRRSAVGRHAGSRQPPARRRSPATRSSRASTTMLATSR